MRIHDWLLLTAVMAMAFTTWRIDRRLDDLERRVMQRPTSLEVSAMVDYAIGGDWYLSQVVATIQQLQNIALDHEERLSKGGAK